MADTQQGNSQGAHQGHTPRRDDADARGEHDYGEAPTRHPGHGDSTSYLRPPNTYVAGEHGTQQVSSPNAKDAEPGENNRD
jgi:hypothetical protein